MLVCWPGSRHQDKPGDPAQRPQVSFGALDDDFDQSMARLEQLDFKLFPGALLGAYNAAVEPLNQEHQAVHFLQELPERQRFNGVSHPHILRPAHPRINHQAGPSPEFS